MVKKKQLARLRLAVTEDGRSQASIARAAGCSPGYLSRLLSGENDIANVGVRVALALSRELGIDIEVFL